jgi:hypothetical protein
MLAAKCRGSSCSRNEVQKPATSISLSAPKLTTVALPGSAGFPDLRLSLKGQPVAVSFPKLEHIVENATFTSFVRFPWLEVHC